MNPIVYGIGTPAQTPLVHVTPDELGRIMAMPTGHVLEMLDEGILPKPFVCDEMGVYWGFVSVDDLRRSDAPQWVVALSVASKCVFAHDVLWVGVLFGDASDMEVPDGMPVPAPRCENQAA